MQARKKPDAMMRVRFATGLLRNMLNLFWAGYVAGIAPVRGTMTKPIFLSTSLFLAIAGQAQDVDGRLNELNAILVGYAKVRLDRNDRLVIDVFADGELVRQDVAYVDDLSPEGVSYNSEEQAVVLSCTSEEPQCIDKEVFKHNTIKHTGRSTLIVPPETGARVVEALRALLLAELARLASEGGATMPR